MDDSGWGKVVADLVGHFGYFWVGGFALLAILVWKSDLVKRLLIDRYRSRNVEREQTWDEAQDIIRNLREEATHLRGEIVDLRGQLRTAIETIASEQRGNARWRHAVNNLLQAYGGMRDLYRKEGIDPPPFRELKGLIELGYDADGDLWMFK